jgi:hypothetical protein
MRFRVLRRDDREAISSGAPSWGKSPLNPMHSATWKVEITHGSSLKHLIKGMNMRQRMEGAAAGKTSPALAPSITINATSSEPEEIAQKVKGALWTSTREFLARAKEARADEARLGYV